MLPASASTSMPDSCVRRSCGTRSGCSSATACCRAMQAGSRAQPAGQACQQRSAMALLPLRCRHCACLPAPQRACRRRTCGCCVHQLTSSVARCVLLQLASTPCPRLPSNTQNAPACGHTSTLAGGASGTGTPRPASNNCCRMTVGAARQQQWARRAHAWVSGGLSLQHAAAHRRRATHPGARRAGRWWCLSGTGCSTRRGAPCCRAPPAPPRPCQSGRRGRRRPAHSSAASTRSRASRAAAAARRAGAAAPPPARQAYCRRTGRPARAPACQMQEAAAAAAQAAAAAAPQRGAGALPHPSQPANTLGTQKLSFTAARASASPATAATTPGGTALAKRCTAPSGHAICGCASGCLLSSGRLLCGQWRAAAALAPAGARCCSSLLLHCAGGWLCTAGVW